MKIKNLKKNQVVIYVVALMLVVAGYLNYTSKVGESIETGTVISKENEIKDEEIGDAKLVSNNEVKIEKNETTESEEKEEIETISNEKSKIEENYFENSKLERNQMYSQMLETYEEMIESANISETQKAIATEEITKINNTKNAIMICENLLLRKGFNENVIFVNDNSISIVIKSNELKSEEIAQIQNIISREMKVEIENIHIMNK